MPRMMVAASPVEIEVEAEQAGLPETAHAVARRMFHDLTDRIAKAAIARERQHEDWPNRRFYFGTNGREMDALVDGLESRPDFADVARGRDREDAPAGLFARDGDGPFIGVLVAHQDLAGLPSPHPT